MKHFLLPLLVTGLLFTFVPDINAQVSTKGGATISEINTSLITDSFIVYGNCGMCKKRIEKSAKSIVGVKIANWDTESQMLTLKYDEAVLSRNGKSLDNISMAVAATGHDTQYYKAENTAYEALPKCCQYARMKN